MRQFVEPSLLLAAAFAGLFALAALGLRALTPSGAAATFVVGLIVFGLGGGYFLIPLLVFFITSSVLSHIAGPGGDASQGQPHRAARDARQVLANGAAAAAVVLVFHFQVHRWPAATSRGLLLLYLAAVATVNADTWSTEIGRLSGAAPRLLTNWRRVSPGTSGAITGPGTLAGLAGSLAIALCVIPFWHLNLAEFVLVALSGFLGGVADSILGASIQAVYRDRQSGDPTEAPTGPTGANDRVRGFGWCSNDMVNLLASVAGVLCALALIKYGIAPYR